MARFKPLFGICIFLLSLACDSHKNSKAIRKDLLEEIEAFIALNEESISDFKKNKTDTDIYWVEFFEKNDRDVVVIMQQPYYHSQNNDGFIEVRENLVFFNFSDEDFVIVSKLNHIPPSNTPDENSREAGLGFSTPNWAYYISNDSLEKFELGQ